MALQRNDTGDDVRKLQRALQAAGITVDDDGDFGAKTEAAVKEFQTNNGLDADGIAGPKTLTALGLDPTTLAPLSGDDAGAPTVINFSEEDVTVPPIVEARIKEFVDVTIDQRTKMLTSLTNALAQFETTMSFASEADAQPDVFGAVTSKVFDMAVDELVSHVPGASQAKALWDAASGELERAGKAAASLSIGNWIKDQRAAIDALVQKVDRDALTSDMEEAYLDKAKDDRQTFFEELVGTIASLKAAAPTNIDVLESTFYEQWVNAQYTSIGNDTSGCIEYRLDYDNDGKTFNFDSCTVQAPGGDKIAGAWNHLLDRGNLVRSETQITKPLDFLVRKRVGLYTENLVGGTSWSFGWLDQDNNEIHAAPDPAAEEGFSSMGWTSSTDRFKQD